MFPELVDEEAVGRPSPVRTFRRTRPRGVLTVESSHRRRPSSVLRDVSSLTAHEHVEDSHAEVMSLSRVKKRNRQQFLLAPTLGAEGSASSLSGGPSSSGVGFANATMSGSLRRPATSTAPPSFASKSHMTGGGSSKHTSSQLTGGLSSTSVGTVAYRNALPALPPERFGLPNQPIMRPSTSGLTGSRKVPGHHLHKTTGEGVAHREARTSMSSAASASGASTASTATGTSRVGGSEIPLTATGRRLFPRNSFGAEDGDAAADDEAAVANGNAGIVPRRLRGGRELTTGKQRELSKMARSGNWRVPDEETDRGGWTPEALQLSSEIWDKITTLYRSPQEGFKGINVDMKGGGISRSNLEEWCRKKNIVTSSDSMNVLFKALDENKDGKITNPEFLRRLAKVMEDRRCRPEIHPRKSQGVKPHERGIREVLGIGHRLRTRFHRRWNTIQKALHTCLVNKGYASPFMRGKVTAGELTDILKRYTGGDEQLNHDAEQLVAAVEITGEGGERGITASDFIDAMSKHVDVTAVYTGTDPLSSYLQQVWRTRDPPKDPRTRRVLREADAARRGRDNFEEWVAQCGGTEVAARALAGGGSRVAGEGEFRLASRQSLQERLRELDALGTSVERRGERGKGPSALDEFVAASCDPHEDVVDYDELVEKHKHPLQPSEPPLEPPASGLVAPPRAPHALGAVLPGERSRLASNRPATSAGLTGPRPATGSSETLDAMFTSGHSARSLSSMGAGPGQGMNLSRRPRTSAERLQSGDVAGGFSRAGGGHRASRLQLEVSEPHLDASSSTHSLPHWDLPSEDGRSYTLSPPSYPGLTEVHSGGAKENLSPEAAAMTPFSRERGGSRTEAAHSSGTYWIPVPASPAPTLSGSLTSPSQLGTSLSATASLLMTRGSPRDSPRNTRYSASNVRGRFLYTGHMVEALPTSPSFMSDRDRFGGGSTARVAAVSALSNTSGRAASVGRWGNLRKAGSTVAGTAAENLQLDAHLARDEAVLEAGARKKSLEARAMRAYEVADAHAEGKQARRVAGMARDRIRFDREHPEVKALAVGEMGPLAVR